MSALLGLLVAVARLVLTAGGPPAWEGGRRRPRGGVGAASPSYYGLPAIHKPHWKWLIITYFFLGGIAGASYVVASIAALVGGRDGQQIARAGRYLSLAALLPSPVLLVLDLGRPERFHHMLRVLKFRSPMSVGTWGLLVFSGFCGLSALGQAAEDGVLGRRAGLAGVRGALPARGIGALGILPAFFVSGYTGVLLAATAVPLWARAHLLLGPLFLASALSTATAAIALALTLARGTSARAIERLERLDSLALVVELALLLALRARLGPIVGRPLRAGRLAWVERLGVLGLGLVAPLGLYGRTTLLGRAPCRPLTALGALCALAGGFLLRYVVVVGGHASADDPHATFTLARSSPPAAT